MTYLPFLRSDFYRGKSCIGKTNFPFREVSLGLAALFVIGTLKVQRNHQVSGQIACNYTIIYRRLQLAYDFLCAYLRSEMILFSQFRYYFALLFLRLYFHAIFDCGISRGVKW